MASMVASGGWGVFNAIVFAGAGYLFSRFNKNGYEKEIRRHNRAMEKLSRDKEQSYERKVSRESRAKQLRLEKEDANRDKAETNKAFNEYEKIMKESEKDPEPVIENYYRPSEEMKEYKRISTAVIGSAAGVATGFILKGLL